VVEAVILTVTELQAFFIDFAQGVGRVTLLVAVLMAALNYALTGTGFKESIVKISKALIFYTLVIFAYPNIVSWMTQMTFTLAKDSTYSSMSGYLSSAARDMQDHARNQELDGEVGTYGDMALNDYDNFFGGIINNRTFRAPNGKLFSYASVAPAAAINSIMLIAGECFHYSDKAGTFDFARVLKGILCALAIMFTGFFALLEYLMAYMEFMFISSVGVILFPLSLYEGTKFMAEKYINAMIGFFIKLLFCTICIFLMLYGYLSLAKSFVTKPFAGEVEQIVMLLFTGLLFFYICKSAPGLAQSLLTGAPSLSATGAISTVVAAGAAVAGAAGMGAGAAGAVGKGAISASGAVAKAAGAYESATQGVGAGSGAFHRASVGMQAVGSEVAHSAGDLTKSLIGMPRNTDGSVKSFSQYYGEKYREGNRDGNSAAAADAQRNEGRPLYQQDGSPQTFSQRVSPDVPQQSPPSPTQGPIPHHRSVDPYQGRHQNSHHN